MVDSGEKSHDNDACRLERRKRKRYVSEAISDSIGSPTKMMKSQQNVNDLSNRNTQRIELLQQLSLPLKMRRELDENEETERDFLRRK